MRPGDAYGRRWEGEAPAEPDTCAFAAPVRLTGRFAPDHRRLLVAPKVGLLLVDQVRELATDRSKRAGTTSRWNIGIAIAIAIGVEKRVGLATGAWLATLPVRLLVLLKPVPIPISIALP